MSPTLFRPRPPLDRFAGFFWVSETYLAETPWERVLATVDRALDTDWPSA